MIAAAATASAEILSPSQALERALGSEETPGSIRKAISLRKSAKVTPALTIGDANAPELYIMTPTSESMMIVSAESEVPALLGYSDDGGFDPVNIPPAMQAMLDTYAYEIQAVRAGEAVYATGARATDREIVMPLCRTTWNQDAPYNYYCPQLNGKTSMTGCVATAMAQVLKVLEWPAKCNGGTETYTWSNGGKALSLNFDNVELAWKNMSDNYTSSSATYSSKATATLMQAVGYAAQMNYSPEASGAYGITLAGGLIKHFDYDCTLSYEQHDWYTQDQWEGMIHKELMAGCPVYCDGANPDNSAGHAFVIDGYQGDGYFHLNWGWGGLSDGFYRMTALDPVSQGIGGSAAGYNFSQGVIVGMKKGATTKRALRPIILWNYDQFSCASSSTTKGSTVKFTGGFYNMSPLPVSNITPGVRFVNNETGEETDMSSTATITNELPVRSGFTEYSVPISTSLTDGKYTVYPIAINNHDKKAYIMRATVGGYGYLDAKVSGTKVTISVPDHSSIKATELKLTSKLYPGTAFTATAKISNNTTLPYNGFVTPVLLNRTTGKEVQIFDRIAIELNGGQSQYINITSALNATVTPGNYNFILMADTGNKAGLAVGVSVESRPAAGVMHYDDLKVTNTAKNNLTFEVTASCQSGYYSQPYFVVIYPRTGTGNYLDYFMSTPVLIGAGEQKTVEVSGNFAKGRAGTTYTAIAYYMNGSSNNVLMVDAEMVKFTLTDGEYGSSDIDEINDNTDAPVEWYDLQGRKIAEPKSGIAIRRQGGTSEIIRL